ncbi:hypothetical protein HPB52_021903 [Rhipicephalus sanguineus]|uniref:THAP-type domain-containing protein n=1 Tax=Rhipicephalus sanguineus TaxID=34632 RepID=A0A9D4Q0D2_RHISA|nr:hypothetical protein HPB52_021903 [Rhipicephalus sanguineus]
MVVCASCGGEDFDEVSGLYYCSECNTQSQDVRVEQVDDEGAAPPPHVGRASPRRSRKEMGDAPQEIKRPYPTNELFNAILVRQVDALISLGASPELRGVVCRLWMDYLVRLEAVSRVEDDERTPRIGAANRWSDLRTVEELLGASESSERKRKKLQKALFGSGVRTRLTPRSSRRRKRLKNRCDVARAPNLDSDCEFESELPATASEGEQASDDDMEDFRSTAAKEYLERVVSRGVDLHDKKIGRENEVTVVTLQRLLCVLYLGVLITGDPILLTDILRWARDGHLPYLHVLKILPEDAKLWGQQWRTFVRLSVPTIDDLAAQAAHLAHFLDVRSELRQPPLLPIVMRLVADLNLPLEFVNVCEQVLLTHPNMVPSWDAPPKRAARSVPLFSPVCEVRAAAVLLLALKLTFGLNGSREQVKRTLPRTHHEVLCVEVQERDKFSTEAVDVPQIAAKECAMGTDSMDVAQSEERAVCQEEYHSAQPEDDSAALEHILEAWLHYADRPDLKDKPRTQVHATSVLCSKHFTKDCFTSSDRKRLVQGAVPSVKVHEPRLRSLVHPEVMPCCPLPILTSLEVLSKPVLRFVVDDGPKYILAEHPQLEHEDDLTTTVTPPASAAMPLSTPDTALPSTAAPLAQKPATVLDESTDVISDPGVTFVSNEISVVREGLTRYNHFMNLIETPNI